MKQLLFLLLLSLSFKVQAIDNPMALIQVLNKKFAAVNDYKAQVHMKFDIPGVKMNTMNGTVIFKRPNKFRIRTKGIFFLPKQNPMQSISTMLLDTSAYTSIISGYEIVAGKNCAIVNIIPIKPMNELILGKFWIDIKNPLVLKSQITTKNNGTIETESTYSTNANYTLPDKMLLKMETKKIKMSKLMSADLNKKSKPKEVGNTLETGTIELTFSNYKINTRIADSEFDKKDEE